MEGTVRRGDNLASLVDGLAKGEGAGEWRGGWSGRLTYFYFLWGVGGWIGGI